MKYLKSYENINTIEYKNNAEKLLKKIENILKKLNYYTYYNKQFNQIEIHKNHLKFNIRIYLNWNILEKEYQITLTITLHKEIQDDVAQFIPEYLKNIKDITFNSLQYGSFYSYKINPENLNNVIKQISLKDFLFKLNVKKYNL